MTRADQGLLLLAVLVNAWLYAWFYTPAGQQPTWLFISAPGMEHSRHALDVPRQLTVPGRLGASVIELEQGRARFIASPCRRKLCLHSGWLERNGAFAACLPNQVTLALGSDGLPYDSINF